jgi:hypothetical protein
MSKDGTGYCSAEERIQNFESLLLYLFHGMLFRAFLSSLEYPTLYPDSAHPQLFLQQLYGQLLTLIRKTKDEKGLAVFKGLLL